MTLKKSPDQSLSKFPWRNSSDFFWWSTQSQLIHWGSGTWGSCYWDWLGFFNTLAGHHCDQTTASSGCFSLWLDRTMKLALTSSSLDTSTSPVLSGVFARPWLWISFQPVSLQPLPFQCPPAACSCLSAWGLSLAVRTCSAASQRAKELITQEHR